jgi:tRNA U34 5-carboxymethylaminomethyl modifying enzyme MnmG/GidA
MTTAMQSDSNSQSPIEFILKQEQKFQEEKKALSEKSKLRIAEKQKQLQQQIAQLQEQYISQSQALSDVVPQPEVDLDALEKEVKELLKKRSKQVTEAIISHLPA